MTQVDTDPVWIHSPEAVGLSVDLAAPDCPSPPSSVTSFGASTPLGSFKHKVLWDRTRVQVSSTSNPLNDVALLSAVGSCESRSDTHGQSHESLNPVRIYLSASKAGDLLTLIALQNTHLYP